MTNNIDQWYVYSYCFLDDLTFIQNPIQVNRQWQENSPFLGIYNLDEFVELVKKRFLKEGWEGDGEIGIMWIPPFIDVGFEDTYGTYIWHVKQQNNGVSWLLSPIQLGFERIKKQQPPWDEKYIKEGWTPENIVDIDVKPFVQEIAESKKNLTKQLNLLNSEIHNEDSKEIQSDLLKYRQGQIIARFYILLDYCYLRFLHSVILENNPHGIKIQKTSVKLSLENYQPEDNSDLENSEFFTLHGVLTDLWNAYKFEPSSKKIDILFKCVDFSPNAEVKRQIKKHIEIRNCIQHHEGRLIPYSLKELGLESIIIQSSNPEKPNLVKGWEEIILTDIEIFYLCDILSSLAQDFSKHIDVRIPARGYSKPKKDES